MSMARPKTALPPLSAALKMNSILVLFDMVGRVNYYYCMDLIAGIFVMTVFVSTFWFSVAHGFTWLAVFTGTFIALAIYGGIFNNETEDHQPGPE